MIWPLPGCLRVERLSAHPPVSRWPGVLESETHAVLLDSADAPAGRFSFLGMDPYWTLQAKDGRTRSGPPEGPFSEPADVFSELQRLLGQARSSGPVPFTGGAMGYLGYELLHHLEDVPKNPGDDFPVPDLCLFFFHTVWAFDAMENQFWLCVTAHDEAEQDMLWERNLRRLSVAPEGPDVSWKEKARALRSAHPRLTPERLPSFGLRPRTSRADYLRTVEKAQEHILAGDIFEVCTSQRFDSVLQASGEQLFRVLRQVSPAPFSALIKCGELTVASSSPERFLKLSAEGRVQTRPIKGTRPRGATEAEDERFRQELAQSEKDLAENMMIVDLGRNDLGRVCRFGSIQVPQLQEVERHAFTHQMVSTIEGQLETGLGATDLLRAAFPGGSITGAPKIEAMKIISRLEPVKRGVFCGSLGYLGFDGAMDLNIAIRTLVKRGERVCFHVGGAVTADSSPEEEYQETLDKAFGMAIAITLLGGSAP